MSAAAVEQACVFDARDVYARAQSHRRPFVASSSAAARLREDEAVFDDLLVGKILEREEFSADQRPT